MSFEISIHRYHSNAYVCPWRGELDTTLCDKVCQWLATYLWFSPGTPLSSTNKIDLHNITEILLKVELNTILPSHINELAITGCFHVIDYISACFNPQTKNEIRLLYIYIVYGNVKFYHMLSCMETRIYIWCANSILFKASIYLIYIYINKTILNHPIKKQM